MTYGRSLDDGNSLNNLLLVHLGTRTVQVTDDSSHTGLVAHGGSQVNGLLGVILREGLDLSPMAGSALAGEVGERAWREDGLLDGGWFVDVFLKVSCRCAEKNLS